MRTWSANVAPADVRSRTGHLIDAGAELTVQSAAPLVFLVPGGTAIGTLRAVWLADGAVLVSGTATPHGADLIRAGVWVPEVYLKHAGAEVGDTVIIHKAEITRVVLGHMPTWEWDGLWIKLDDDGTTE